MGNQMSIGDDVDKRYENKVDYAVDYYWNKRIQLKRGVPLDCSEYKIGTDSNPYKQNIMYIRNEVSFNSNLSEFEKLDVLQKLKQKFIAEWGGMDKIYELGTSCQWYKLDMYNSIDTNYNRMLNKHWFNVPSKGGTKRKKRRRIKTIKD
jgi:hypothetical protein